MRQGVAGQYRPTRSTPVRLRTGAATAAIRAAAVEALESRRLLGAVPVGPEFLVNTFTGEDQKHQSVAADADGDFVVVWASEYQEPGGVATYAQRYNRAGVKQGGEILVASEGFCQPSVAMDADGDFVVAFDGYPGGIGEVFFRRYNAQGEPQGQAAQVNQYEEERQGLPQIAMDADGDFVITWTSTGQDAAGTDGVYARRYAADGTPRGDEFRVNNTTAGEQNEADVAMDDAGDFVVVWTSNSTGFNEDVYARRYGADGTALANEFRANANTVAGDQSTPAVGSDADGDFVVVWSNYNLIDVSVYARRYNAAGAAQGAETPVHNALGISGFTPAVSVDADGDYVVTFNRSASYYDADIYARQYTAAGAPRGPAAPANSDTGSRRRGPSNVAMDDEGDFVVAWASYYQDAPEGGGAGVYGRRFDVSVPTADVIDVSPDPHAGPVAAMTVAFSEPVTGLDVTDLALRLAGGPNLLTAAQTVTTADGGFTWTLANLSAVTAAPGDYTLTLTAAGSGIADDAGHALAANASDSWRASTGAAVVGRRVFYNNSFFDGNEPAANAADDGAVAPDKVALRPGQTATFANYTSYSRGINGVMIDIAGLPAAAALGVDDLLLLVGNDNTPADWPAAPAPAGVTVRPGAGTGGSDRVTITWPDNAIRKTWLQVTLLPTPDTGLLLPDVFYFGNAVGESGNSVTDARVTAIDETAARANQRSFLNPAPIDFRFDYNRDRLVNATDQAIARANQTSFVNDLKLIAVPGAGASAATLPPSQKVAAPPARRIVDDLFAG